jgi:O-antigen/teichoic acid export membrane protein
MMTNNKKQFAFNVSSGWIAQIVFTLVGFILLSYSINRLGEQGFGVYQLARSALVFFMFLQLGMGPTLVRFYSQAIAKDDQEQMRKISSTAQLLLGGLGLIASLLCLALIPIFIRFYEIPLELVRETTGLLICMAVSLFLNMTFIVPQGLMYGSNRYDLANGVDIVGHLIRLGLVVVLFELLHPSVFFLGVAMLSGDLFRFVALFLIGAKQLGRSVCFSFRYVGHETMGSLLGFSMLNLANSVAQAVVFQGPVLIIGKVLGEEMVTAFAPALLIASAMQGFLGQTTRPLVPLASRNREVNGGAALGKWAIQMGQIAAFVGFAIVLPLTTFGPEIMTFWLGEKLTWIWPVVAVVTTGVAVSQVQAANYFLALGGGGIKPTVYSQIAMAVTVFTGTLIGTVWFGWHLFAVALYLGSCIFVRNTMDCRH